MRYVMPVLAILCFSLFAGCGGGGSSSKSQTTTTPISSTFPTSNTGPGTQSGASGSSGSGASGTTTSGSNASTPDPVTGVIISPATATLQVSRRLTYTALGLDSSSNAVNVPAANWKWTSSNPAVALLTSTGNQATVAGVAPGTTTITALEGASGVMAQVQLTVVAANSGTGSAPGGSGITGGSGTGTGTSTQVYANDFVNGAGNAWSNTTISTTPGTTQYPATKFLGMFANNTDTLTLGSLPTHTSITLEFDFFCILTWDGNNAAANVGPSLFNVTVEGGPTLINSSFANITAVVNGFPASSFQSFPDAYPAGSHPYQSGAALVGVLGYTFSGLPCDSVYHLKYTFPHTSSAVKIDFTGNVAGTATAAGPDDFWGLKNVQVTTNP